MNREDCFSKIFPSLQALQNNTSLKLKNVLHKYSPKKRKSLSPKEEDKQLLFGFSPPRNSQTIALPINKFNKFINLMQEQKAVKKYHKNRVLFINSRQKKRENDSLVKNLRVVSYEKQRQKRVNTQPDHLLIYSTKKHEQRWNSLRTKMEKNQVNIKFPQLSLVKKTLMISQSPNSSKNTTKISNRQRPSFKMIKSNVQINQKKLKFQYENSIHRAEDISAWGADDY